MTTHLQHTRTSIIKAYLQQDIQKANQQMQREFAYFSANLYNFLPHIPRGNYLPIFNQLQANRMLADRDIEEASTIQANGWTAEAVERLHDWPGIICTWHTGSYRFLSLLLAQANIPVSVVVAGNVLQTELTSYRDRYVHAALRMGIQPDIAFIDAEHPHSLIAMARAAKSGRSLLLYLDGNTGATTAQASANKLLEIPFRDLTIRVRKGMAVLAHRLALPIHPVACLRSMPLLDPDASHKLYLWRSESISTRFGETAEAFTKRALCGLYQDLTQLASRSPHEWEGWLHIHHDLAGIPQPNHDDVFNAAEWVAYRRHNSPYFLHLKTYRSVRVSWVDYRNLNRFYSKKQ